MVGVGARQPAQATWGEPMAFRPARMRDIASARRMMFTRTDQAQVQIFEGLIGATRVSL
jgi:hypothetical protein